MRTIVSVLLAAALFTGCAGAFFGSGRIAASARALAIQPDGKIVAAGTAGVGNRFAFALVRYLPDGRLDTGFGVDGTVLATEFRVSDYVVPTLALQPDGKVIVAGDGLVGQDFLFALARYLPDGGLDPTFGTGGVVTTPFTDSRHFASVRALALQPDGKVIAAGLSGLDRRDAFALARYRPDGTLDATFGGGGTVRTVITFGPKASTFPGFVNRGAFALARQPDGRVIAGGATDRLAGTVVFALARYLSDGRLDRTFGDGGTVATDFGAGSLAFAVALQPDGKIVAAGTTSGPNARFALARYLADGALDRAFGTDGRVITDFGSRGALALALQPDGKLVVAGSANLGDRDVFAIARYLPDGRLDPAFGTGGTVTTDFSGAVAR
ncbi:MAG: hypothetical protein HYU41_12655 [Candidatus Rokubacteria bacterium]|nr:hypothetical protein [Candidatus Rokubacteria bacterium]